MEYKVHRDLLTSKSDYFCGLFNTPCKEAKTNRVDMTSETDTKDAHISFAAYVYRGEYCPPSDYGTEERCRLHAQVYVLAERLVATDLKSRALLEMEKDLEHNDMADWKLDITLLVWIVDSVYSSTPSPHSVSAGTASSVGIDTPRTESTDLPWRCESHTSKGDNDSTLAEALEKLHSISNTDDRDIKPAPWYKFSKGNDGCKTQQDTPAAADDCNIRGTHNMDGMRALLVRYMRKHMKELQQDRQFRDLLRVQTDVAIDVVSHVELE